jgi:hypothetical protein
MSVNDITFSVVDQRETQSRLAIVMDNVPEELSEKEIVLILRRMHSWVVNNLISQKQPPVQRLRDALDAGLIDQTAFDFLTG